MRATLTLTHLPEYLWLILDLTNGYIRTRALLLHERTFDATGFRVGLDAPSVLGDFAILLRSFQHACPPLLMLSGIRTMTKEAG